MFFMAQNCNVAVFQLSSDSRMAEKCNSQERIAWGRKKGCGGGGLQNIEYKLFCEMFKRMTQAMMNYWRWACFLVSLLPGWLPAIWERLCLHLPKMCKELTVQVHSCKRARWSLGDGPNLCWGRQNTRHPEGDRFKSCSHGFDSDVFWRSNKLPPLTTWALSQTLDVIPGLLEWGELTPSQMSSVFFFVFFFLPLLQFTPETPKVGVSHDKPFITT